ncbi:lytic transglycosylase domain-containing protein [Microbacterium album]|uniref:Transglycosylase SLT domain-containing protein n=1 Tax=Microbacterium album TaxID=2053191 RepID=A0A917MN61_9MICO|nr:lytic murein transglycosylase [Microbacterium album]GGH50647.1 hypothetical protein GCM10010921_29520 [Microbacterium album]
MRRVRREEVDSGAHPSGAPDPGAVEGGDGFDALLRATGDAPADRALIPAARQKGRGWLAGSIGAVLVGVVAIAAGPMLPRGAQAPSPAAADDAVAPPAAVAPPVAPSPSAAAESSPAPLRISELVDRVWVAELSARTGIPFRPLRAYTGAAAHLAVERPECGLGWNTLAAIGRVESAHGTIGGSWIDADGDAVVPIIGIALDGTASEVIRDTDGGALDGDSVWDRAVGPMQFIPSTWAEWGADGNGDGMADPQNIDDAALSAARYLCEAGGDLTVPSRWIAAIAAYNDTIEYNLQVAEAANHYARLG